ncbi:ATP-binding protein [Pleurocapsa sp. PCC 7327]|uniref:sensor histidine kinase n=1 Tax=Pleurocapsa sp. PCC 7327 TaxID=118163 RepID=UPI00059BF2DC
MKKSLEGKWIAGGLSLALLLMGFVSLVSYQNATRLIASANQMKQTHQVLKTLTDVVATLTNAEAGRRGYILFEDEEELERYNLAIQGIDSKITQLQQLLDNDPNQQRRLAKLNALIEQRLAFFQQLTDLYENKKSRAAQDSLIAQTKQNQREILQIVAQIQTEEEQLLQIQVSQTQSGFHSRMSIEILGTILTFVVLLAVYALLYQQMVKRQQAEIRQRILAQEKELSELKLNFFSMVSHEFRTPLSLILGSAQLLLASNQQGLDPKERKNLDRIQSSARVMTKLLADLLTLTRAEAGKLECKPYLLELQSFCLNLVEDMQVFDESSHSIEVIGQGALTHAYLDEKLLYSILSNLLSKAIKYSPSGGKIRFVLRDEPGAVVFQIQDEGIGIPSEDLKALYEPFHRSKNVKDIAGTGLGLAVVKKCLELHQGEIFVESQEGVGTTFTVKIPQESACP